MGRLGGRLLSSSSSVTGLGDVAGPASATDNAFTRFDLTTGKLLQNSGVLCDDSNNLTGLGTLNTRTIANFIDGPAISVDNTIPRFDLTTGKLLQASGITIDDSNNLIGLNSLGINTGSTLPVTKLEVVETVTTSPRGIMSAQYNDGTDGARFHMRKGRGTLGTPTTIVSGDNLGRLVASGYDGAAYQEMGSIIVGTEGTIAAGRVPTNIQFHTATNAATSVLTERMRIDSAGLISIGSSTNVANMTLFAIKTSIHTFTNANWNEDGATWTMAAGGPLVHVTGNTTTVTATLTEAIVTTTPTTYKITIIGTGNGGTAAYTFGGVVGTAIAATGAIAITDYITASTTASMIITPASGCTVSITSITIDKLTDSTGDLTVEGNINSNSQLILSKNPAAYPAIRSPHDQTGIYFGGLAQMQVSVAGSIKATINNSGFSLYGNLYFSDDAALIRLAANSIAMRAFTMGQTFSLFETYTDASNYESYSIDAGVTTGDTLTIKGNTAGTGADNLSIALTPAGTGALNLGISTSLLGFYGVTAIARAVLATGVSATVDNVITALQNLGLVKQA